MATLQIRKKTVSVWAHVPSDGVEYIVSKLYCKTNGDYFRVIEWGSRQRAEYHYSDITVYDDTQGGAAESFISSQQIMLRLAELEYPGFNMGGGGSIGWQPNIYNPQNGQTIIYNNGIWQNGYINAEGNAVLQTGEIVLSGQEITLEVGFIWRINGQNYANSIPFTHSINYASTGYYRADIIVATSSGNFIYIEGIEDESVAVPPSTPDNTLLITTIYVTDDSIDDPDEPIIGNQYITKESEGWKKITIPSTTLRRYWNENDRKLRITSAPNGGSFGGFHNNGGGAENAWDGNMLVIFNDKNTSQTVEHMQEEAYIKMWFADGEDYVMKPLEMAIFFYNKTELRYEMVLSSREIDAVNVSYDNTESGLTANNTQDAIDELQGLDLNDFTNNSLNRYVRLNESLVKLEENMTFTVGTGKDFEDVKEAIDQALNYYPNADYKITILIDGGHEINNNIYYQGLDFSHIVIKTTDVITVNPSLTGDVFRFDNCWLPVFDEFDINGHTSVSHLFYFQTSFTSLIKNSEMSGFKTTVTYNGVFSARIENTIIEVPAVSSSYGINAQNSYVRVDGNTQIVSLNTDNLNITSYGALSNSGSILSLSGTPVLGNFRRALWAQNATIISSTQTLEAREHHLFVERGATIINRNTGTLTSNVPLNTFSGKGLILNENKPNPINFDGTDYILDYIKAPSGQEYNVTVDDTGKLKSEPKPVDRYNKIHYSLVSLYEAELLNLHNTPINIPLDLQPNEYAFIAGGLSYIEFSGIESGSGEIEMLRIQIINEDDEVLTGHTVSNLTLDQKRCNVLNVDPPSIIEFFNPPATKMSITTPAEAIITQPEGMVVKVKVAYMIGEF